jgi:hypothetical protein
MNGPFERRLMLLTLIAMTVAIPFLIFLATKAWTSPNNKEMSGWRRSLGMVSILVTSLLWILYLALPLTERMGMRTDFFNQALLGATIFLSIVGSALSLALRGKAKAYGLLAGLFMLAEWALTIVH